MSDEGDRTCEMVLEVLRYLTLPPGVDWATRNHEPTGITVAPAMRRYVTKRAS